MAMQEYRKRYTGPVRKLPGLPDWESELLCARGIDSPEKAEKYLNPCLEDLHDPLRMQDMDKALKLIWEAADTGERVMVYGDYDVDGISAVTILLETLREAGVQADFRIPLRHSEGYGLNAQAVREIAENYRMLITVDCGIANAEEVRLARELGMRVIVTDHHEVPQQLPPADAVLNPLLGDYPFRRLCGAGVALKICQALRGRESMERRLEVAALATVADIVPLTDENRVIVREGMRRMEGSARPGLQALMQKAQIRPPVRSEDIAFRLAPRLNAAGRLGDAALGVRLLMTEDPAEALEIAEKLEQSNRERQEQERQILKEAETLLPEQADLSRDRIIILEGKEWNTGLIGLAAGKLCEKYHHPAIVLSRQGEKAVGSCRSIPGINIWEMLNACDDGRGGESFFVRFGGHAQAAGLTIQAERIPELRERLNDAIRTRCDDRCFLPVREYDTELELERVSLELIRNLEALEPTGCGNPEPVFRCRGAAVQECRPVGKDGSHLKLKLLEGTALLDGIGFGLGAEAERTGERLDVLYQPARNEFNGKVTAQLQVRAVRPAGKNGGEPGNERDFFLDCVQEMGALSAKKTDHIPTGLRPEHLLKERLDRVDASREAIGKVWKAMAAAPDAGPAVLAELTGMPEEEILFALAVFEQLGLIRWDRAAGRAERLPSARKTELDASPAVRYIINLRRNRAGEDTPDSGRT